MYREDRIDLGDEISPGGLSEASIDLFVIVSSESIALLHSKVIIYFNSLIRVNIGLEMLQALLILIPA